MSRTVLIVEDERDTREMYRLALERRGYRVLTAEHGAEGVHLARRRGPDLILLDIRMPVMDGVDALTYLRTYPETMRIPVCAISAYELQDDDHVRLGSMHFDCVLTKPVQPTDVVAEVESRIGPP